MSDSQHGIGAGGGGDKVKVFSGRDFHLWKFQLLAFAEYREVDEFILGIELKPGDDASVEEKRRWKRGDSLARTILLQSVDYGQMQLLTSCATANEMWEKLKSKYETDTLSNQAKLRKEFHNIKKGKLSLDKYIKEFDALCDKLRGVGVDVKEEDKILQLTEGLPSEDWDVIVTAILETRDVTYEEACNRLLVYEARHKGKEGEAEGEAFLSGRGRGQRGGRGAQRGGRGRGRSTSTDRRCYRCGETGHMAAECTKALKCFKCSKTGHISKNCQEKGNQEESSGSGGNSERGRGGRSSYNIERVDLGVGETSGEAHMAGRVRDTWIIDSGCTQHMCNSSDMFLNLNQLNENKNMVMGNGGILRIDQEGDVGLRVNTNYGVIDGTFRDVLYAPQIRRNLVSVTRLMKQGISVIFDQNQGTCVLVRGRVHYSEGDMVGRAHQNQDLWVLDEGGKMKTEEANMGEASTNLKKWHLRLGHLGENNLRMLFREQMVKGIEGEGGFCGTLSVCEGCMKGKQCRNPFPESDDDKKREKLELVHSDVCGPIKPVSLGGNRYYVLFVDHKSRKSWVYLMKKKSEVFTHFKRWKAMVEKQSQRKIVTFRTDRGGEYLSNEFKSFLLDEGIVHELSNAGTPQQNGVAERMNRVLQERARSMLIDSGLKADLWGEAINTACYLRNRSPSRAIEEMVTPEESWSGWKPSIGHLRVFGCRAHVLIPEGDRRKMGERSWTGALVGYGTSTKGWRVYNPETGRVEMSRDVRFSEREYHFSEPSRVEDSFEDETMVEIVEDGPPLSTITSEQIGSETPAEQRVISEGIPEELGSRVESEESEKVVEPRRSTRVSRPPQRLTTDEQGELHSVHGYCNYAVQEEPASITEAMEGENKDDWKHALESEHQSIIKSGTYELVERPVGKKILRTKYVLKIKRKQDGSVDKFKVRLVVLGNMQRDGVDYKETFAPVLKYQSLRVLLAIANEERMHVHQMDVKTAFLNGELEEEVYVEQPEGLIKVGEERKVWKLRKALYGLKQAPRAWNKRLNDYMMGKGFKRSSFDTAIYFMGSGLSGVFVAIYVDDILVISRDLNRVKEVKKMLSEEFEMSDFGEAQTVLGIQIKRNLEEGWLELDQARYTETVLDKFGMSTCRSVSMPLEQNLKFSKDQGPSTEEERDEMGRVPYKEAVGSLMYLMVCTRMDIAAAVGTFSRFMQDPGRAHWEGIKRVLRYLRGTSGKCLRFERQGGVRLSGFCDSDFAGCVDTRRSTSGYLFLLGGGAVSWSSKRQPTVVLSSTEAEYVSGSHAAKEALWLKRFLEDLGWKQGTVLVQCDNTSALKLMKNPQYHSRTKHIEVQYHFLREKIEDGELEFRYIGTDLQCADFLTKGLGREKHLRFCREVGLVDSTEELKKMESKFQD